MLVLVTTNALMWSPTVRETHELSNVVPLHHRIVGRALVIIDNCHLIVSPPVSSSTNVLD